MKEIQDVGLDLKGLQNAVAREAAVVKTNAHEPVAPPEESSTSEQIKRIDNEMKLRLLELHDLMSQEGFDESIEVVQKCTELLKQKQRSRSGGKNVNANASFQNPKLIERDVPLVRNSKSMETIYDSAVPK